MGLDLTLLPFEADFPQLHFSHTILNCERRGDLFQDILKLPGVAIEFEFDTFMSKDEESEFCYGPTQSTAYGEPLRYVFARDLKAFSGNIGAIDNHKNRAVWAYLDCLPDDTKVALYWS